MIRLIFLTKFLSKSILIFVQLINVSKFVCIISTNWHPSRRENRHHRFKQFIIQIIGPKLIHKLSSLFLFYRSQYPIKVQTFCRIISRRNLTTNLSSPTWPPSAYLHSLEEIQRSSRSPRSIRFTGDVVFPTEKRRVCPLPWGPPFQINSNPPPPLVSLPRIKKRHPPPLPLSPLKILRRLDGSFKPRAE